MAGFIDEGFKELIRTELGLYIARKYVGLDDVVVWFDGTRCPEGRCEHSQKLLYPTISRKYYGENYIYIPKYCL